MDTTSVDDYLFKSSFFLLFVDFHTFEYSMRPFNTGGGANVAQIRSNSCRPKVIKHVSFTHSCSMILSRPRTPNTHQVVGADLPLGALSLEHSWAPCICICMTTKQKVQQRPRLKAQSELFARKRFPYRFGNNDCTKICPFADHASICHLWKI